MCLIRPYCIKCQDCRTSNVAQHWEIEDYCDAADRPWNEDYDFNICGQWLPFQYPIAGLEDGGQWPSCCDRCKYLEREARNNEHEDNMAVAYVGNSWSAPPSPSISQVSSSAGLEPVPPASQDLRCVSISAVSISTSTTSCDGYDRTPPPVSECNTSSTHADDNLGLAVTSQDDIQNYEAGPGAQIMPPLRQVQHSTCQWPQLPPRPPARSFRSLLRGIRQTAAPQIYTFASQANTHRIAFETRANRPTATASRRYNLDGVSP